MELYRADAIAIVANTLGEARGTIGMANRLPELAGGIIRSVREGLQQAVQRAIVEQSPANIHINLNWQFGELSETEKRLAVALEQPSRSMVSRDLEFAVKGVRETGIPMRWEKKIARIIESIETSDTRTLEIRITDLAHDLVDELAETMFLFIPARNREYYEQKALLFGDAVASKFPDSSRDIAAAGRCLALDEWTACVIHLMRALEQPLHVLADRLNITFPKPIEFENWKNIVDKIDSEITKEVKHLEAGSASHERNRELKLFGDAATQLRHFKNAWRNDAAHGREHYDEREAIRVYGAVNEFMQMMAELSPTRSCLPVS